MKMLKFGLLFSLDSKLVREPRLRNSIYTSTQLTWRTVPYEEFQDICQWFKIFKKMIISYIDKCFKQCYYKILLWKRFDNKSLTREIIHYYCLLYVDSITLERTPFYLSQINQSHTSIIERLRQINQKTRILEYILG